MQEEGCFLEGEKLSMKIASVRVNTANTRKKLFRVCYLFLNFTYDPRLYI